MTILDRFIQSNVWCNQYHLPLCRMHANPHMYLALSQKILRSRGEYISQQAIDRYHEMCEPRPGLFNRYPDGGGGVTSHDELIGIAYLSSYAAERAWIYLQSNFGIYDNQDPQDPKFKHNLFRFPWFIAFLKARIGEPLNWYDWIQFNLYLFGQAMIYHPVDHPDDGGRLLTWLMSREMRPWCSWMFKFWDWRMRKSGPKDCFSRYLRECPVFFETAPERFL